MPDSEPDTRPVAKIAMTREAGVSGLKMEAGRSSSEWLRELRGAKGANVRREMMDNDPVVGAMLAAFDRFTRNVEWVVDPADPGRSSAMETAEFVEGCMHDMSQPWVDLIDEASTKYGHGWALCELVYKERNGFDPDSEGSSSEFDDGRLGWRKIPLRSQETLHRWIMDENGGVLAMVQRDMTGEERIVPLEKALLFRTTRRYQDPEGRSLLRNAYTPWWRGKRVQEFEAIGIERDLAGIPSFGLPPEVLMANDDAAEEALAEWKRIGEQLRNDEQAVIMWPLEYDELGNKRYEVGLMGSPGQRMYDTSAIIERQARYVAMSVLADVIMLGHESVGSYALSRTKYEMLVDSIKGQIREIADVVNRFGVRRLLALNGLDPADRPTIKPVGPDAETTLELIEAVRAMAQSGFLVAADPDVENHLRRRLELPVVDTLGADPNLLDLRETQREMEGRAEPTSEPDDAEDDSEPDDAES